jgi:serine/threonine-protein kinase
MIPRLDRARWAVLSPYLDQALDLAAEARAAWLLELRSGDAALAAQVEALLEAHGRVEADDFLEDPPAPRATLAGQTMGAYTLREPIGHGGMGSVWRAERTDGRYEGVVAVKLLNASLIGQNAEARFRREGSILARLRHRHIAHLIDAGISPAAQPFLVLEYVDGEHVDAYCDRLRLGVPARVRLFLDVLTAVAHAHANLIVHRDLKPANVLVDHEGSVKLLDFGVAKLLAPDAESTLTLTQGGTPLTPEYAAPEQLAGGDVTTATDVYALGVLLYVLLAGRHPAKLEPNVAPGELIRTILEQDAPPLSSGDTTKPSAGGLSAPAQARNTTPQGLRRALRGDLETVVAKTLKKDPGERYSSVSALVDDLQRYLDHAPISARPDSLAYRATKFVRRHRAPVALASVLLAALAAGMAGIAWQARVAARERSLALAQLRRAESINEFMGFVMGQSTPGGAPVRIPDILARAERLAAKRSEHDPGLAVDLFVSIGNMYLAREETDNARRAVQRAYELSQGVEDRATRALAACTWARAVAQGGESAAALRLIDEGLGLTSQDERFDSVVSTCLLNRALVGMRLDSAQIASAATREALGRLDRYPDELPELRANVLQMMAMGHRLAGEPRAADRAFARALEELRRIGREDSLDAVTLLGNWATNTALTDPLAASEQNRRTIALFEGAAPDSVPVIPLQNYALQLSRLARHAEARAVLERAMGVAKRHGNAQQVGLTNVRLAHVCLELGDLACARQSLAAAAIEVAAAYPAGHRVRGDLLREQGLLAEAEGRDADALRLIREAFENHRQLKDKTLTQIETLLDLSRLESKRGSAATAEARARDALAIAEGLAGGITPSSWTGRSLLVLGTSRAAQGQVAEARDLFDRALAHMEPTLGPEHPATIEARRQLRH